jgi:diaminopimelate epimerase
MTPHGSVSYEKYHGTGNDFVVVDADDYVPDRAAFAARHCDRERGVDGVGADGVLFLALESRFSPPRVVMTLVQPDGSTAAMCGNGARIAAEWAMTRTGADAVMIDTQAGTRRAHRVDGEIAIEMGEPSFDPDVVPLADAYDAPMIEEPLAGYAVTGINTGVPHAVVFVDEVSDVDLAAVAPPLREHAAFPEGANVTFAAPADREDGGFDQRTYERGVEGETDSCGTGAVAIAAAARETGRLPQGNDEGDEGDENDGSGDDARTVRVSPPGGDLVVTLPASGPAVLRGPVVHEGDGTAEAVVDRLEPQP